MKILITGAAGMVARAAATRCALLGDEVIALSRGEMDIADIDAVRSAMAEFTPDSVINCAAYTNVDGAESEPQKAIAANSRGVVNLAVAARQYNAGFVTISTDYVFDGEFDGFYTQRHQPNPLGVYARSKRNGELAAIEAYARTIIVRTGWIYGAGGTNFLSVLPELLRAGKDVTAIADSFGTPTFADDLALRLRELAELDLPGIYHVTNSGEGTSYFGFAEAMCEAAGLAAERLRRVSHRDLKRPAPRPVSSKLACLLSERLGLEPMPEWKDAISRFAAT